MAFFSGVAELTALAQGISEVVGTVGLYKGMHGVLHAHCGQGEGVLVGQVWGAMSTEDRVYAAWAIIPCTLRAPEMIWPMLAEERALQVLCVCTLRGRSKTFGEALRALMQSCTCMVGRRHLLVERQVRSLHAGAFEENR